MAFPSYSDNAFPRLLTFFSPSSTGWHLPVPDIGANSGFPGFFDWNEHFDDDDGAFIVAQTEFAGITGPGFKALDEQTNTFAFISFERSADWTDGVLNYRISSPTIVQTSADRPPGINMELSAALAAVCLQIKSDWIWLLYELENHPSNWTIRTVFEVADTLPAEIKDALYEISNDAACRFYDDHAQIGQFTGFEEPVFRPLQTQE